MSKRGGGKAKDTITKYLTPRVTRSTAKNLLEETVTTTSHEQENNMAEGGEKSKITNDDLHKLLTDMREEMNSRMGAGFTDLNNKVDSLTTKLDGLEMDISVVKADQQKDREEIDTVKKNMAELQRALLTTQCYSRKYHLLIYGVPGFETDCEETISVVRKFAAKDLKLGGRFAEELTIRNAHRLRERDGDQPTPIIAVFLFWHERQTFLRAGKNLKGTRKSVRTDLPPALKQYRNKLATQAYKLRQEDYYTRIREKFPDVWLETRRAPNDEWTKYDMPEDED